MKGSFPVAATFHTPRIDWFKRVVDGIWWDGLTGQLFLPALLLPLQWKWAQTVDQFRALVSQRLRDGVRQVLPDALQQMFPPREAGADTRARTLYHWRILECSWANGTPPHTKSLWRWKRAPSPLQLLLSAQIKTRIFYDLREKK